MADFSLGDYVDVNERLAWFFDRFPEGSLQADILERGEGYVVIKALAYRSPMDDRPGSGMASEPVPGRTPYTKDSEIMVGETSAWGRALAAIGAPTKGSIASVQEVANRTSGAEAGGRVSRSAEEGRGAAIASPAQDPAPDTSSAHGEDAAIGTGGGSQTSPGATTDAPGPPHYALDPSACDHHRTTGSRGLLSPRKSPRGPVCPRCGLSYITVTEGTSADLGSA